MSACEWRFINVIKRVRTQTDACVVFIWTSHLSSSLRFHSWLFTDMSLLVFPMISSSKGQHFLWSFYPATRGTDIFTSHLIPGLWKPSCFEVIVVWMCHWKLMRDSWWKCFVLVISKLFLFCFIVLPKKHSGCAVVFFWMQIQPWPCGTTSSVNNGVFE